jgi:hypothetical protein
VGAGIQFSTVRHPAREAKMVNRLPDPSALILVTLLPAPRDLEIARMFGWYRIPFKSAPRLVAVDYLAFYQPGAFGKAHRWRIEYIAPVLGHELTTRQALLNEEIDHPRASEAYYKIQIAGLIDLPAPVLAGRWKRVTFFFTTGKYLLNARYLADLVVAQDERRLLWQAIRERASRTQNYRVEMFPEEMPNQHTLDQILGLLL